MENDEVIYDNLPSINETINTTKQSPPSLLPIEENLDSNIIKCDSPKISDFPLESFTSRIPTSKSSPKISIDSGQPTQSKIYYLI